MLTLASKSGVTKRMQEKRSPSGLTTLCSGDLNKPPACTWQLLVLDSALQADCHGRLSELSTGHTTGFGEFLRNTSAAVRCLARTIACKCLQGCKHASVQLWKFAHMPAHRWATTALLCICLEISPLARDGIAPPMHQCLLVGQT